MPRRLSESLVPVIRWNDRGKKEFGALCLLCFEQHITQYLFWMSKF